MTNAGWALEIALDVETAHAICQNCKILLVEATSASLANLGAAENRAVTHGRERHLELVGHDRVLLARRSTRTGTSTIQAS